MASVTPDPQTAEMLRLRYGSTRPPAVLLGLLGVVAVVAVVLFVWIAGYVTNPPVRYKLLAYQNAGPTSVVVTYEVRRTPGATVTCVLRAQDDSRVDVGYAVVTLAPDGSDYIQPRYPLTTLREAFTAEVLACEEGPDLPRGAPAPQFGPGVDPPAQQPPGRAPTL